MSTPPEQQPRMRPTNLSTLFVAALGAAAVAWIGISNFYGEIESLPWVASVIMLVLGVGEWVLAFTTRARIERREGTVPVNPLMVAWYVVLAKASAVAGALFTGVYVGLLAWLIPAAATLSHAGDDLPKAAIGLVSGINLAVAGLALERACRVPDQPDDEHPDGDDVDEDRPTGGRTGN
jgi:hypothetical protein